ncbi:uncharacterized protein LOC117336786 [Pecten maximus]|uniref:uncharacterized protein LOC117336786 n=1 Tax=Pecten maximus TaxID=6579 RepID=UPI0014581F82|nr:uncharacterized protein LOC117336786 [Pecten maximus]
MNPYGTRWRCKGKNLPAPETGHVTPSLLRLNSTGEITSDSGSTDRYISDMGTLIDSACMKIQKRMEPVTKRSFMDCKSASTVLPMHSDFLLNQIKQQQAMDSYNEAASYSAPHWGYNKKMTARPNSCAFPNFRNSSNIYNPEFRNFRHQKTGFHPAMTGHYLGQRNPNKASHRCQHSDRSSHRPRHSFPSERVPSDCTNWRKMPKETNLRDDCPVHQDRIESKTEPPQKSVTASQNFVHSKNVSDHKNETPKPVINTKCAMPSQEKSYEDSHIKSDQSEVPATTGKENDKGSNGQKSASVQFIDWFECGQSEENSGTDVPQRIGFRVRTLSLDAESSNDPSVVNNKTLQREASVLSDIFQPDDTVFHVTCMFKENDSMAADKESGNSTESQPNEYQPSPKDDYCDSIVERSDTDFTQNTKCAEKKSEPSDLDKDCARRIVLLLRNNNKKGCRPSAKKRRRSKARKEDPSEIPSSHLENHAQKVQFQERNCKETNSQNSSATKKLGPTNTVAFVLGIDSNNSANPLKQHSFLVSFDSESDDFSEDSGDDFSDSDGVDELDFFSCPLQLNVICPVNQADASVSPQEQGSSKSCDVSEERQKRYWMLT